MELIIPWSWVQIPFTLLVQNEVKLLNAIFSRDAGSPVKDQCFVDSCEAVQYSKKLCNKHYRTLNRTGKIAISDSEEWTKQLPSCHLEDCSSPSFTKKMCIMHYTRWNRFGDPEVSSNPDSSWLSRSTEERFWEKVQKTDDCWLWTAYKDDSGYGKFSYDGGMKGAHRYSYMLHSGETLNEDIMVDHRCHVPACVRPEHLRKATAEENGENKRGASSRSKSGIRGVSMHPCGKWQGHVGHKGKVFHVGLFVDIADAEAAVIAKRNELHTFNDHDRGTAPTNVTVLAPVNRSR